MTGRRPVRIRSRRRQRDPRRVVRLAVFPRTRRIGIFVVGDPTLVAGLRHVSTSCRAQGVEFRVEL